MSTKSMLTAALSTVAITGAIAGPVSAGEITGSGKPTGAPLHANSFCVYSGKNDAPDNPLDIFNAGGPSQSYGQLLRLGLIESLFDATPSQFNPSDSCNKNAA